MNIALYIRVANENETSDITKAQQINMLKEYAENHNYKIVLEAFNYSDGLNMKRDGLEKINKAVLSGSIDLILVKDISQISRNIISIQQFIYFLRNQNISLISIAEDTDYTNLPLMITNDLNALDLYIKRKNR